MSPFCCFGIVYIDFLIYYKQLGNAFLERQEKLKTDRKSGKRRAHNWLNFGGLLGKSKISWIRGKGLEFEPVFSFCDLLDGFFNLLQVAWESISGASGQARGSSIVRKMTHSELPQFLRAARKR